MLTAYKDVIICGVTSRLLVARNRMIGCVFALTSRQIGGGWILQKAVSTAAESSTESPNGDGYPYPLVRVNSFENWNPLNCSLGIGRDQMMGAFQKEATILLTEWEALQPGEGLLLRRAEMEWEKLTGMLPLLGVSIPSEYEERQMTIKVKLRLLGEPLCFAELQV